MRRVLVKAAAAAVAAFLAWTSTDMGKAALAMTFPFPITGHKYVAPRPTSTLWRINITAQNGGDGNTEMCEVGWITSYYGLPIGVGSGGTAAASSSFGASTPDRLYNGNDSSDFWTGGSATSPQWTSYTFASPVDIVGIVIVGASSATRSPKNFDIQYSLDSGSSWHTTWSVSNSTGWSNYERREFMDPAAVAPTYTGSPWTATAYWRIKLTSTIQQSMAEVEMRATPGGSDQCNGGTPSSDGGSNGSQVVANAFDNNVSTLWARSGTGTCSLFYTFSSAVQVAQLVCTHRNDGFTNNSATQIELLFGTTSSGPWRRAFISASGLTWTNGEVKTFTDPLYI